MNYNAGVIGHPVTHSLSPKIHNAIYATLGVPWNYGKLDAPSDNDVASIISQARSKALFARDLSGAVAGFNVTTPHKKNAYGLADIPNVSSYIVGGANTLTFEEICGAGVCAMKLCADTTDGEGACRALENRGAKIAGASVLILGTGATAISIMVSAIMRGAQSVKVASRNMERAGATIQAVFDRAEECKAKGELEFWGFSDDIRNVNWTSPSVQDVVVGYDDIVSVAQSCNIVINATPLGMNPDDNSLLPAESFGPHQTVMDAIYAHGLTQFREYAQQASATAMDGLGMLVEQALLSMAIWFDVNRVEFSTFNHKIYEALAQADINVPAPEKRN